MGLPRLERGSKALLIVLATIGVGLAIATNAMGRGDGLLLALLCIPEKVMHGEVWRLVTSLLITSPASVGHLIFSAMAIYFLGPDIERRWGTGKFLAYFFGTGAAASALAVLADTVVPFGGRILHPGAMMGPGAALAAMAIAWGSANPHSVIRFFFLISITGRTFVWLTLAFSLLPMIYPMSPEGATTPLFASILGMIFGAPRGEPSFLRRVYLEWRLKSLQRQKGVTAAQQLKLSSRPPPPPRGKQPILRVVRGNEGKPPPKDKRWLN